MTHPLHRTYAEWLRRNRELIERGHELKRDSLENTLSRIDKDDDENDD